MAGLGKQVESQKSRFCKKTYNFFFLGMSTTAAPIGYYKGHYRRCIIDGSRCVAAIASIFWSFKTRDSASLAFHNDLHHNRHRHRPKPCQQCGHDTTTTTTTIDMMGGPTTTSTSRAFLHILVFFCLFSILILIKLKQKTLAAARGYDEDSGNCSQPASKW